MNEAGWQPDPTGRHEVRYFDGTRWSDHVGDGGQQATDTFESTVIRDTAAPDQSPLNARSPRWPWIVAVVAALIIGLGVGAAAGNSKSTDLQKKLAQAEHDRDIAVKRVNDREALRRSNTAKASATRASLAEAERAKKNRAENAAKATAAKATADAADQQKLAADALAAQQKADADAAAALAAAAIRMNTVNGDGVYAIGTDKAAGRYHTDGTAGCYYAVLNSPDTFDIATNDNVDGPTYVELPAGKFFESKGCATWTKV